MQRSATKLCTEIHADIPYRPTVSDFKINFSLMSNYQSLFYAINLKLVTEPLLVNILPAQCM